MASANALANAAVIVPLATAAGAASAAYAGHALLGGGRWRTLLAWFCTAPGRTSRLLALLFVVLNLKSMPFVWTFRIFGAMIRQTVWKRKPLPPQALFHYAITSTRASLLETDYNFHKSNSTYFSDLDASRTHLVTHLFAPGVAVVSRNAQTRLVCHPSADGGGGGNGGNGEGGVPVKGSFGIGLGAVFCSFRKEIAPYQGYELWSRVLAWDRKWLYVLTHVVVKGKVRPPSWDGQQPTGQAGGANAKGRHGTAQIDADLQPYVIATAVSKYVFKLGRFTVHPTYMFEASDLLPARPGEGWRGGGPEAVGNPADVDTLVDDDNNDKNDGDNAAPAAWTWKDIERERQRGMAWAAHLAALDGTSALFDGAKDGALGRFSPG
ncbi:hypothetical protein SPI_02684 [Niveomyces insectorum RCEF 264]|uniref:Capsule polysaccharide biosynthesis protein n=1 Tax=Niveomyces insectorum RCEF 264 TaxID=1081102 RepID=A0A167Y6D0_9HYPO|nr:hypothetical protein SPI_02684 [Niveomyces insectorum RCEF 264]